MSNIRHDIEDSEIRIISSDKKSASSAVARKRHRLAGILLLTAGIVIAAGGAVFYFLKHSGHGGPERLTISKEIEHEPAPRILPPDTLLRRAYVEIADTTVHHVRLTVFSPRNATPRLHIGVDILQDSGAVFVVQAADVREDNGGIVGAYVSEGRLLSKGQSKSGFCAIIGGTPIIGVADATQFLEQALETEGYFFRQYPLVVGNQIVENKPRGRALRKALAELNGKTVVVMSRDRLTFHDFSQALADLGVSNAIYLVGSSAYGFAKDAEGHRIEFGQAASDSPENTNYIVWE